MPGRRPARLRARAAERGRRGRASSSRSPSPTQIDTNLISAGAYVLEREVLELIPPDRNVSIEREVLPRAGRQRPLRLRRSRATGWTSARPSATCRRTFDILEGNVETAVASASTTTGSRSTTAPRSRAASIPPALRRARRARRRRRARRQPRRARRRRRGRRGRARRALGGPRRRRDRRGLRAARLHRRRRRARRRGTADRRRRGARRGRHASGRTTCSRAGRVSSRGRAARRGDRVLTCSRAATLDRDDAIDGDDSTAEPERSRSTRRSARRRARARAPARRAVARRVGDHAGWDTPGGPGRRGHGRLGDRRRAGARRARRPRLAADLRRPAPTGCRPGRRRTRWCCARATRATPRRRSPATSRPARSAPGASSSRPAGGWPSWRAPTACPVIPLPGGFQPRAAVAYMTVAALEVAALCGAGPRLHVGDRRRRLAHRAARRRVGPGRARGLARQGDRARRCTAPTPVIAGAGLTHADRLPLEDADQRERQAARASARELPELDHNEIVGWEGAPSVGRFSRRVPRRLRRAPARRGSGWS